jgi:hypothetical protein
LATEDEGGHDGAEQSGDEDAWTGGETGTRLVDDFIDGSVVRNVLAKGAISSGGDKAE